MVAAVAAGEACLPRETRARDYLVLHDLSLPAAQEEDFARVLTQMASLAGNWERIVFLRQTAVVSLDEAGRTEGRAGLRALLKTLIGIDRADEIFLTQNRIATNRLLLNAFSSARKICYGDGLGVNFSYDYFHSPLTPGSHAPAGTPVPAA